MTSLTADLKQFAQQALGFHLVGITSPEPFAQAELDFVRWLGEGHQADMAWLTEARARLACRPRELLPGARSLVVVGVSYRTAEPEAGPGGRIARYAWGRDYHDLIQPKLRQLASYLTERAGRAVRSRVFVDSSPLVERDAAVRAGLGFRGKNTNLLTSLGSYVFLGALLTDVDLEFDAPLAKDCGACRLCLDACPTDALATPYHLAAERCIAYLTIEHRGPIPTELRPPLGEWVFGCDVCQEVCPYNASTRRASGWPDFSPTPTPTPTPAPAPAPRNGTRLDLVPLLGLDEAGFRERFRGSPIKRARRRGLARNAAIALGNRAPSADATHALQAAADADPDPVVREAAAWALAAQAAGDQPRPLGSRATGG